MVENNISKTTKVTIIIPCYNEGKFIEKCLFSILENDYPKELMEILVIDGMSNDETKNIVDYFSKKYPLIRLLDNKKKITSCGLNIGLKNARYSVIIWLSAHNVYSSNYISKCVFYLNEYAVDSVGGIIKTLSRNKGLIAQAISFVLTMKFGVGNSYFRTGVSSPKYVDTMFGTCYRRDVFEKVGFFNEDLVRGQDLEFSLRMRRASLRMLLVPDLQSNYFARSRFGEFLRHNFINGLWALLPFMYTEQMPVSIRHLMPLLFIFSILFFTGFAFVLKNVAILLGGALIFYLAIAVYFSTQVAIRERNWRYAFVMPVTFAALHFSYGIGSLFGFLRIIVSASFWRKRIGYFF